MLAAMARLVTFGMMGGRHDPESAEWLAELLAAPEAPGDEDNRG
ncbi:hypothetical protein [Speluncibacter jeojiensis]|uniref:Uncharacterized protein n=1 Tax=Speluncibacter jeojiensis TaxID=2710754 RepID=A0A9X4RFU8_9ACTN|nr:hypothetical protein [Rhodococcus sp. D2-41]MDG3017093.1 hypothetical protein [Corynebacteriales bacterium D3-21]